MLEFIVVSEALTTADHVLIENYLSAKYEITLAANDVYFGDG